MERCCAVLLANNEEEAARLLLNISPADLNWAAVAARAPIWLARRKAFIVIEEEGGNNSRVASCKQCECYRRWKIGR
jgi:hypothetical protein